LGKIDSDARCSEVWKPVGTVFDGRGPIGRSAMRDRQHRDSRLAVGFTLDSQHNDDRPGARGARDRGIEDDEARLGFGIGVRLPYLRIEHLVEMAATRGSPRASPPAVPASEFTRNFGVSGDLADLGSLSGQDRACRGAAPDVLWSPDVGRVLTTPDARGIFPVALEHQIRRAPNVDLGDRSQTSIS
jgi:hypothetical protein